MRIKPIVAGVDGSPESARAALTAWRLSVAMGVPLELVHAVPDFRAAAALTRLPVPIDVSDPLVAYARERVMAPLRDVVPAEALATLRLDVGRPEAVLAAAAADARLVVLGGKHHGVLARHFGGSTAHHLIRTRDVPVLITAAQGWPIRRVLVAVDLSFAAEPTLAAARDIARASDARLRVLHVIEPVAAAPIMAPGIDLEAIARRDIEEFSHRVAALPEVDVEDRVTRHGPAAQMIAAEAADWHADVVVMGSHGRGWVERLLVGSVTERVLALLPASLLVVPVHAHAVARATASLPEATGALP